MNSRISFGSTSFLFLACVAAGLVAMSGCSDNPASGGADATVTMQASLSSTLVNRMLKKDGGMELAGAIVDSLHISRVRVLISELKFHRDKEDTIAGDKTVKVGPIVMSFDSLGARTFTTGVIPAGDYDKVKFEFHRLSSSEVPVYLADTTFADFVTNDRWTVIIEGSAFVNGTEFPFTYRSNATANLSLKFSSPISISGGTTVIIVVSIDPVAVFRDGTLVLDPRDKSNEHVIDNAIKDAIHALRH